jgi:hypothetical protein
MANDAQKQTLLNVASLIRAAEQLLIEASRNSTDPNKSIQINSEYQHLDSLLSQIIQTQTISDDADFQSATSALQQQATALQAEQADIQKIVDDVGVAAKVAGYLAQAASFLAAL